MKARTRKLLKWLLILLPSLVFLALISLAVQRISDVTAVQNSISRNYEINFGPGGRPHALPEFIDNRSRQLLDSMYEKTVGDTNLDLVYGDRFRALFQGPIREIFIVEPDHIKGDLGAALLRFSHLQRLRIQTDGAYITESDWKLLCSRLKSLAALEELSLEGSYITDSSIAPLSGHPRLRKLEIDDSTQLTPASIKTFATLPALKNLVIGTESEQFKPEDQKAMKDALPGVKVEFQ